MRLLSLIKKMSNLPSPETPLNQHSLGSIELWLKHLGAVKSINNPCLWTWSNMPKWSAEIHIKQDELMVIWDQQNIEGKDKTSKFSFPYGLPRQDVEAALNHGP